MNNLDEWVVDIGAQTVTHHTGLVVEVFPDALFSDKWAGRCLNARTWASKDFDARAHRIARLLQAAIEAYETAHKTNAAKDDGA